MALGGRETWATDGCMLSMLCAFHSERVRLQPGGRVQMLVRSIVHIWMRMHTRRWMLWRVGNCYGIWNFFEGGGAF